MDANLERVIAQHSLSFIGGTPKTLTYHSNSGNKRIDIIINSNVGFRNTEVVSTLGLYRANLSMVAGNLPLRLELITMCDVDDESWRNILASAAFEIMDFPFFKYGMVVQNVVGAYKNTNLKHAFLTSPVFWDKYQSLVTSNCIVAWLMPVPVSDSERRFILKNGPDAFETLLEEQNANISDLNRKPLV